MSAPDLPRFKVSSDAYSVFDTWNVHRIVVSVGETMRGAPLAKRKAVLAERCAELEAWHTEVMADDAA